VIRVIGKNRKALLTRLEHHAAPLVPFREAFVNALLFHSSLASDNDRHILRQSRTGAGSWSLHLADGRRFYFRSGLNPRTGKYYEHVDIHDEPFVTAATTTVRVETPEEMFLWVRKLTAKAKSARQVA